MLGLYQKPLNCRSSRLCVVASWTLLDDISRMGSSRTEPQKKVMCLTLCWWFGGYQDSHRRPRAAVEAVASLRFRSWRSVRRRLRPNWSLLLGTGGESRAQSIGTLNNENWKGTAKLAPGMNKDMFLMWEKYRYSRHCARFLKGC